MRKFTLFLFVMLIGSVLYAQKPVVTPVWDHSVYGTADWSAGIPIGGEIPAWMGNLTERGMAVHDGKIYIVSRKANPPFLLVLDAETGNQLTTIPIDTSIVKGGTFAVNDISITPSGKILFANLSTNSHTQPFKVYMMEEDGEGGYNLSTLLSWNSKDTIDGVAQPLNRLGDGFAFYGDVSEEGDGYIIVADATATLEQKVFRWNVQAGLVDPEPKIIVITTVYPAPTTVGAVPKFSTTPRISPISNDLFWADGHATLPALYNMQGEMISTFTGQYKPIMAGISGVKYFSFKEHDFILAPTTNWAQPSYAAPNAFQLFLIPAAGAEEADSIAVIPVNGLGKNSNGSFAAPMGVEIQNDHVMMYVMFPNNGIAAYKLTLEEEVSDVREWNMSDAAFNALGSMTQTTVVNGLTIYAKDGSSQNVEVDANIKTLEEWAFTHRLKFGGSGNFDENGLPNFRVLSFNVEGNSKITIALMSSSGSANRVLNVSVNHKDSILAAVPALGDPITKQVVEYKGGAGRIFLYSPSSGVNIYLIRVEPLVTNVPIVSNIREEVKVFPNPASGRVFVNVNTPTEVGIFTLTGSLVKLQMVESSGDAINIGDMKTGVYIIKSTRTNDFATKLIVR
jgi:hypothetical protein